MAEILEVIGLTKQFGGLMAVNDVSFSVREREILLRTAPTLVRPVDFVLPFYEGDSRPPWILRAGLSLYDWLAGREGRISKGTFTPDALRRIGRR